MMTDAHSITQHFDIVQTYPAHEPREHDPHYHLFLAARRRMERQGLLRCWINNADCSPGPIELHHTMVEFSLQNIVDVAKFATLYPEFGVVDDETFAAFVEGESNLTALCPEHHRGSRGIHSVTYPAWVVQRYKRPDATAPERRVIKGT